MTGIFLSEYIRQRAPPETVGKENQGDLVTDHRTLATLQALAEPNRLRIVELLRAGPLTVGEIAQRLDLRQPQASKHLKVLTDSGILEVRPEANRRIYGLKRDRFQTLDDWASSFTRSMEERYEKLESYLDRLTANEKPDEAKGNEEEG